MPYGFSFDLSHVPQEFQKELIKAAYAKNVHGRIGRAIRQLAEKFKIREIAGLNISEVSMLIEDLVNIQFKNINEREKFLTTKKRALFLPHCSRKYMDKR